MPALGGRISRVSLSVPTFATETDTEHVINESVSLTGSCAWWGGTRLFVGASDGVNPLHLFFG